jgi:hypothetical protein
MMMESLKMLLPEQLSEDVVLLFETLNDVLIRLEELENKVGVSHHE